MLDSTLTDRIATLRQRRTAPLILELDLTEGIAEEPPGDPLSALATRHRLRLADVLDGLRRARADHRVKALVAKVGGRRIGLAQVQELRAAVQDFAAAGKLTVAWSETFGDFSPGNVPYYLATAFERIWLQPSGDVGLTGISLENRFYRGTLDTLGVDFQVARRKEYKSAAERFTERKFSDPAREENQRLAASIIEQISEAIGQRLQVPAADARALIDNGPFMASEALDARLVDALGYRDEVYEQVKDAAGDGAVILYLSRYQRSRALAERARRLPRPGEDCVALIYATGPIRRGRSARGPLMPGAMGSDTMTGALRAAAADSRAKAIVLRVNSPGGSYVASDAIWREVVRAREGGTPVVVSMGEVAASGGYFIAMAANAIVAQPGTITGSIGVLSGKPVLGQALERAGITTDSVSEGAHADMFSTVAGRSARRNGRRSTPGWTGSTPTSPARSPPGRGLPRAAGRRTSPGAGCGPGPTLRASAWSTSSAGWPTRSGWPGARRACRRPRRCGCTRATTHWTGSGRPPPARSGPPPRPACSRRAGDRCGGWPPAPAWPRTARCTCRASG